MPSDFVEIVRFLSPEQASVVRCALEAADIQTFLDGEAAAGWLWHLGSAIGGVRLLVKRGDAERAREVLSSHSGFGSVESASVEENMFPATAEEDESEILGTSDPPELVRAWRAALIGLVFLPLLLNIYSMWLLFRHDLLIGDDSRQIRWRAVAALTINMAVFALWAFVFW